MGNILTIGKLKIVLDNPQHTIVAGTRCQGRLRFIATKPLIVESQETVRLRVEGFERVTYWDGNSDARQHKPKTQVFFQKELDLHTFPAGVVIKEGTEFQYPFLFEIPHDAPSCEDFKVHYSGSSKLRQEIKYRIVASFKGLKVSCPLHNIVSAPLTSTSLGQTIEPRRMDITKKLSTSAKRSKMGPVLMGVAVDNTHLEKGETLTAALTCRNESLLDPALVSRVVLKLILKSDTHRWERMVAKSGYPLNKTGDVTKDLQLRIPTSFHAPGVFQGLLPESHRGQLIKMSYILRVEIPTVVGITTPALEIPLFIGVAPIVRPRALSGDSTGSIHFPHSTSTSNNAPPITTRPNTTNRTSLTSTRESLNKVHLIEQTPMEEDEELWC